ncbi:hypothetical protein NMG60_11027931 [Bertholletia excelsa]
MEFHLLPISALLYLALVACHAALSPEAYWNAKLPNTRMPNAIKELLQPEVDTPGKGANVDLGKKDVYVSAGPYGKPVYVRVPEPYLFKYFYAAEENQLHDNPNVALFFLEKDLKQGTKMTLHFTRTSNTASFLPREEAEKIPFSSNKFPEVLDRFSVKPNSVVAKTMKQTIKVCEEPGIEGEEKYCATSLESMIDFSISGNGKNHIAISTEAKETPAQKYSVTGVKKMGNGEAAVCHKLNYPYAVFYCHKTRTTKAYLVSMAGEDGTKVKAAAVCHTDTSKWNPKHLAFLVLKVKPGTVPICHFLPEDHVVWVSN